MTVTDFHLATLRAQLQGRVDEHRRLLHQLDPKDGAYVALINGAFSEAVSRRFLKDGKPADDEEIIDFVASSRMRMSNPANLDPAVAEILIKLALGKFPAEAGDHLGVEAAYQCQILLVSAFVGDTKPSAEELEEFLAKARSQAEDLLS